MSGKTGQPWWPSKYCLLLFERTGCLARGCLNCFKMGSRIKNHCEMVLWMCRRQMDPDQSYFIWKSRLRKESAHLPAVPSFLFCFCPGLFCFCPGFLEGSRTCPESFWKKSIFEQFPEMKDANWPDSNKKRKVKPFCYNGCWTIVCKTDREAAGRDPVCLQNRWDNKKLRILRGLEDVNKLAIPAK